MRNIPAIISIVLLQRGFKGIGANPLITHPPSQDLMEGMQNGKAHLV